MKKANWSTYHVSEDRTRKRQVRKEGPVWQKRVVTMKRGKEYVGPTVEVDDEDGLKAFRTAKKRSQL